MTAADETLEWRLDRVEGSRMKTLALLLADPNPIHFDPAAADAALGTGGRVVNQGPSTIAMVYNLFARHRPHQRVRRLEVRLLGNVLEGDQVAVTATPSGPDTFDVVVRSWPAGRQPEDVERTTRLTASAALEERA